MEERFSKQNLDLYVKLPSGNKLWELFTDFAGLMISFFPIFAVFLWFDLSLYLKMSEALYISGFIVLGALSVFFVYLFFIKSQEVVTNYFDVKLKKLKAPLNIIFVSDIHIGSNYIGTKGKRLDNIVNKINNSQGDIVVFGGDFIYGNVVEEELKKLCKINKKHKYAVLGNHDTFVDTNKKDIVLIQKITRILTECGFKILDNEGELIEVGEDKIYFYGIPDLYTKEFHFRNGLLEYSKEIPKILISHNPDIVDFVKEDDSIGLILSGHNHAGQIKLPFIGTVLPVPGKYKWLTHGVYQINKITQLFVSQGVGFSGTRIRFGTEAEVCEITLHP